MLGHEHGHGEGLEAAGAWVSVTQHEFGGGGGRLAALHAYGVHERRHLPH